jgi:hypothetical protein
MTLTVPDTREGERAREAVALRLAEARARAESERWYGELVARVRERVRGAVPPGAHVLVVTKGDERLLELDGRRAGHFPQTATGLYSGFHPADGAAAAQHLDELRAAGSEFFVIPATALWWLDHYPELRDYLERCCELVVEDRETCLVYSLTSAGRAAPAPEVEAAPTVPQVGSWLDALLPQCAGVVVLGRNAGALRFHDRPIRPVVDVDPTGCNLVEILSRVDEARADGVRYVAALKPVEPFDRESTAALRRALADRFRLVAGQLLADVFDLTAPGRERGARSS